MTSVSTLSSASVQEALKRTNVTSERQRHHSKSGEAEASKEKAPPLDRDVMFRRFHDSFPDAVEQTLVSMTAERHRKCWQGNVWQSQEWQEQMRFIM